MANKQYKFRLRPSDEGPNIYVGELLETSDGTGPLKFNLHLKEESDIYVGELLDGGRFSDIIKGGEEMEDEGDEEEKDEVKDGNDDDQKEENSSNSSRTMECEQSDVSITTPEFQSLALPPLPGELNTLDEAPFKLEESMCQIDDGLRLRSGNCH
ncbi:hypothetical protein TWF718_011346 [Orbilia javanica]|uniref:Uncharacterized protein n=1 Tax=Orbilia javanica TaxID=47235 RepID=A0AAN8RD15_9PEZI